MNHKNFKGFNLPRLAMDGPPLPEVHDTCHAIKIVIVSVLLGYFDVGLDVCSVLLQVRPPDVVWARRFLVLRSKSFFLVLRYGSI